MDENLAEPLPIPRKLRPLRWLFVSAFMALVWYLPHLLMQTDLRHSIVAGVFKEPDAEVRVGRLSAGWLSPIVLYDTEVKVGSDRLFYAPKISNARNLLQFLLSPSERGTFVVEKPVIEIVFTETSSNAEQAYIPVIRRIKEGKQRDPQRTHRIELVDAIIRIIDKPTSRNWEINPVTLTADLPGQKPQAMTFAFQGKHSDAKTPGTMDLKLSLLAASFFNSADRSLELKLDHWPLAMVEPIARRFQPGIHLFGPLSSTCNLRQNGDKTTVDGSFTGVFGAGKVAATLPTDKAGVASFAGSTIDAHVDLDVQTLANELGSAIALRPGLTIDSGSVSLDIKGEPAKDGARWSGSVLSTDLVATQAAAAGQPARKVTWSDPINAQFAVLWPKEDLPQVEKLTAKSGFLSIEGFGSSNHVGIDATFDLDKLRDAVDDFLDLGPARFRGKGKLVVRLLRGEPSVVSIDKFDLSIQQLLFSSGKLNIAERELIFATSGSADILKQSALLHKTWLTTESLALVSPEMKIERSNAGNWNVDGEIDVGGELGHMHRWIAPRPANAPAPVSGQLQGRTRLTIHEGDAKLVASMEVVDLFVAGDPARPNAGFREPKIELQTTVQLNRSKDQIGLDPFALRAGSLSLVGKGFVDRLSTAGDLRLGGEIFYDLDKLQPLVAAKHPLLKLSGSERQPFDLTGSMFAPTGDPSALPWKGNAGVAWHSVDAAGFRFGPAQSKATIADGWVTFSPIQGMVNEGQFNLEPSVKFAPAPTELYLKPGVIASAVRITPEMCRSALTMVMPIIAGATQIDGRFSVAIDQCKIPLDDPVHSTLSGRIQIDSLDLAFAPIAREIAAALGAAEAIQVAQNSIVYFDFVEGRVRHRDMQLALPDLKINMYGSVGLDESLNVMIESPVPGKILGPGPLAAVVRRQTIRIPITGTIEKPQLDKQELRRQTARFVGKTAKELLEEVLRPGQLIRDARNPPPPPPGNP